MTNLNTRFKAFCASAMFLALGAALIPFAGVQNDEALFGNPLYLFNAKELSIIVFHRHIPLMVMSYVGTLKTWIYAAIFLFFRANVWTVRLPMVLAGALTVFIFYRFTSRAAGPAAALIAGFLLATDPSFLVTNTFDWGPVALGHLLLVTGCFCLLRFWQEKYQMHNLALGFFFLGLGLWNKALMLWALAGLGCAVLWSFWRELRQAVLPSVSSPIPRKTSAIGIAAFLLGALPFVLYNVRHPNATLQGNAHIETAPAKAVIEGKLSMVRGALNGSGLFGFIPAPDWIETLVLPSLVAAAPRNGFATAWESVNPRVSNTFSCWPWLAIPWWWRVRAARFALVFMWLPGWRWPLPAMPAAPSIMPSCCGRFRSFSSQWCWVPYPGDGSRWPSPIMLIAMNLLVVNEYIREFDVNGANGNFTDALFPLSDAIPEDGHPVYVVDWGMANTIALFHQGRILVRPVDSLFITPIPH